MNPKMIADYAAKAWETFPQPSKEGDVAEWQREVQLWLKTVLANILAQPGKSAWESAKRAAAWDDARSRSAAWDDARSRSAAWDDARSRSAAWDDARSRSAAWDDARQFAPGGPGVGPGDDGTIGRLLDALMAQNQMLAVMLGQLWQGGQGGAGSEE